MKPRPSKTYRLRADWLVRREWIVTAADERTAKQKFVNLFFKGLADSLEGTPEYIQPLAHPLRDSLRVEAYTCQVASPGESE